MRIFVKMRQLLATNEELACKVKEHDRHITNLYEHVEKLTASEIGKKEEVR